MRDDKLPAIAFGEVINQLRTEAGLTQDAVAELAQTDRAHISALERAKQGPSIATLFSIADALSIPPGDLISRVDTRLKSLRLKK
jgi:transcriptional regulator with XRE-family HTH domain